VISSKAKGIKMILIISNEVAKGVIGECPSKK
jgi:hypothetical protein